MLVWICVCIVHCGGMLRLLKQKRCLMNGGATEGATGAKYEGTSKYEGRGRGDGAGAFHCHTKGPRLLRRVTTLATVNPKKR